ncbi:NACHT and WD repeat domain-containing protein [Nonomuraea basaltis]|uniref:NACHT and WD repeat domain-containing protein n=1 Tax=Nonomuraea basaltis TaxID=2495887 RepID=UPI00110C512D|nr:NACHT and WD repeat domain-containing protein [Nonomuraea basaltis]TMR96960.1 hypothetical protein EJK15_20485 [Nonomuraea basaltis]
MADGGRDEGGFGAELRRRRLQAGQSPAAVCPYPGLAPFGIEDADWFFGRDRAVADLLRLLADPSATGHPVMLVGPSGVGKSSLLRAGLTPAVLREALPGGHPGSPSVLYLTPNAHPLRELRERDADRPLDSHTLVIVDQFEEVFTLCDSATEREAFVGELCRAAAGGLAVVIAVRADFFGRCVLHPPLLAALRTRALPLGPMTKDELRPAIAEPAAAAGLALEPGLAEILLRDLGVPGSLPLLSHTLRATWQHRDNDVLTVAGYERTGGVHGAVATTAERVWNGLPKAGQDIARRLLPQLVHVGDDQEDTRRRVPRDRLAEDDDLERVIEAFTRARLLTADAAHIEISHEALLVAWPRLREWIDVDRAGLRVRQQLTEAATTWQDDGRDSALLYRGSLLAVADEWAAARPGSLEEEFLAASRRHEQRDARLRRRLTALLAALAMIAAAVGGFAWRERERADQDRLAGVSQRVAEQAGELRATNPWLAAQLAVAAYRLAGTVEARGAVLSSAPPYATRLLSGGNWVHRIAVSPDQAVLAVGTDDGAVRLWDATDPDKPSPLGLLPRVTGAVDALAFRPAGQGRILLTSSAQGTWLWDVSEARHPRRLAPLPHPTAVRAAAFTAHGLVTTGQDRVIRHWNLDDPRRPTVTATTAATSAPAGLIAVSRDDSTMITGHDGGAVHLWDLRHLARPIASIPEAPSGVTAVAIAPDGRTVAYAGPDKRIRQCALDEARRCERPRELPGSSSISWALEYSPDGTSLATAGNDKMIRLWDVATRTETARLPHPSRVLSLAYTPDGATLAAGAVAGTLYLWRHPAAATRADAPLIAPAVTADRSLLISGDSGHPVRLWDLRRGQERLPVSPGESGDRPVVSDDGRLLATIAYGRAITLWDITTPHRPERLHRWPIHDLVTAAFSPGNRTLATGDDDGNLITWDIRDPRRPEKSIIKGGFDAVNTIDFSRDGRLMATGDTDGGVRLWDVRDPTDPKQVAAHDHHTEAVAGVRLTSDNRTLISTGHDWTVRVWDITDPATAPAVLTGHNDTVTMADLSPDESTLITVSHDRTARLWDLTADPAPTLIAKLAHPDLGATAFTAGGRTLVSSGHKGPRLWDTRPEVVIRDICRLAGAPITQAEWTQYFGPLPYRPPCRPDGGK